MKRLVIFASGSGSNVEAIASYFKDYPSIEIAAVLTNKKAAGVLDRCERLGISAFYFNREALYQSGLVADILKSIGPDLIVLAGFLWKIPEDLITAFEGKMINIHPALLPKYGGKGMYGLRVHKAVKEAGESESGITIHYVNPHYDEGQVIFQATTPLNPEDSPEIIARKVLELEHRYYPRIIKKLLTA